MTYKLVEPKTWKYENDGDTIEGILIKAEPSYNYNNKVYTLRTDIGLQIVFGTTVLDDKMGLVTNGAKIKIVYKGTKESEKGKNPMKMFEVYLDEDDVKDVKDVKSASLVSSDELNTKDVTDPLF